MSFAHSWTVRVAPRRGFTMLELLTVVAIMTVLMGMLTVGVRKAMTSAKQSGILFDISKIATAIESVKAKSGAYPPCMGAITSGQVSGGLVDRGQRFDQYVSRAFPRSYVNYDALKKSLGSASGPYAYNYRTVTGGTGTLSIQTIDQAEAIVFWLGGFPTPFNSAGQPLSSRKLIGFSTDPMNPFKLDVTNSITTSRTTPLFDFDESRLGDSDYDGWLEYYPEAPDPFNPSAGPAPYVYFDAPLYRSKTTGVSQVPYNSYPTLGSNAPYTPGLAALSTSWGVACPYAAANMSGNSAMQWANPDTFQIITAGLDNIYGPATLRVTVPATGNVYLNAVPTLPTTLAGNGEEDNLTNFLDSPLVNAIQP